MSEIKSTIDLVMERTRNLKLSDEERKAARVSEWTAKARGWILKYLDLAIDLETFKANVMTGEKELPEIKEIIKGQLLDFVKLDGDNGRIFPLFKDLLGVSVGPLEKLIETCHGEIEKERRKREEVFRRELEERGITGAAIVPNPARNKSWISYLQAEEKKFSNALRTLPL